jgi:hypothetical protein
MVGQLGLIGVDGAGKLQCHICGRGFHNLGSHAATHNTWTDEYKAYFGLGGQSLKSDWLTDRSAKRTPRQGIPNLPLRVYKRCAICNEAIPWRRNGSRRKTCGPACLRELHSRRARKVFTTRVRWRKLCSVCGEVIERRRATRGIPRTCSDECARRATRANRQRTSIRVTKVLLQAEGTAPA